MKRIQVLFRMIGLCLLVFVLLACNVSNRPAPEINRTATAEYATMINMCCTAAPDISTVTTAPGIGSDTVLYLGDPQRTGVYNLPAIRAQPDVKWKIKVNATLLSSPLVVGDNLYVGSSTGRLFAFHIDTGEELWSVSGFRQLENAGAVSGDLIVSGGYSREIKALDRHTGSEVWSFETEQMIQATPLVVGERAYIATYAAVYALDLSSGSLLWEVETGIEDAYMGAPAYDAGVIYTTGGKLLLALDAETGKQLWRVENEELFLGLAVNHGLVYVGNWNKTFYAFDTMTGEVRWKFQAERELWSPPALGEETVYVGNLDTFYALNAQTGALRWSFKTDGGFISEPLIAEDVVYFSDANHETDHGVHHLYALDAATGEKLWQYEMTGTILTAPALGQKAIYITSTGEVIALQ